MLDCSSPRWSIQLAGFQFHILCSLWRTSFKVKEKVDKVRNLDLFNIIQLCTIWTNFHYTPLSFLFADGLVWAMEYSDEGMEIRKVSHAFGQNFNGFYLACHIRHLPPPGKNQRERTLFPIFFRGGGGCSQATVMLKREYYLSPYFGLCLLHTFEQIYNHSLFTFSTFLCFFDSILLFTPFWKRRGLWERDLSSHN